MNMDDRRDKILEAVEAVNEQLRLAHDEGLYIEIDATGTSMTEIDLTVINSVTRQAVYSKQPACVRILEVVRFAEEEKEEHRHEALDRLPDQIGQLKAALDEFQKSLARSLRNAAIAFAGKRPAPPAASVPAGEVRFSKADIEKMLNGGKE